MWFLETIFFQKNFFFVFGATAKRGPGLPYY